MRILSWPAAARWRSSSSAAAEMPASCTLVRPRARSSRSAVSRLAASSPTSSAGTWRSTRPIAASTSTPVASPLASRSMRPPAGSGVSRVMPASCSARLLAQPAWPSTRLSQTGRWLSAESNSAAVGKRPSFQAAWFQPPPVIHAACGRACACALTAASAASRLAVSRNCRLRRAAPSNSTWPWASMRPGISTRPPASRRCASPA